MFPLFQGILKVADFKCEKPVVQSSPEKSPTHSGSLYIYEELELLALTSAQ